jgi:23S rRNA pseudouridine1911/1915/1917 synthase
MLKYRPVYDNHNFLVINKPAGLLVHGADHIKEPSLVDQLLLRYPGLAKIGEDPGRPGIVHRLDKNVSGLMVIAKTQAAFDHLKKQFRDRIVVKTYSALVYGKIAKEQGLIDFPIQRSSQGNKMAAQPRTYKKQPSGQGKPAVTEFKVSQQFINYTLLEVKIKTGRTHQIRVHLAAFGHPLVGDDLYGNSRARGQNKRLRLEEKLPPERIMLVASQLSFSDLNGQIKKYQLELPAIFKNFMKHLK